MIYAHCLFKDFNSVENFKNMDRQSDEIVKLNKEIAKLKEEIKQLKDKIKYTEEHVRYTGELPSKVWTGYS